MINMNNNSIGSCSSNSLNTRECNGYWVREAVRRRRIRISAMFIDKLEFTVDNFTLTKSQVLNNLGIERQDAVNLLQESNIPATLHSKYYRTGIKFHKYKRYKLSLLQNFGVNRDSHLVNDDFTDEFHLHLSAIPRGVENNFIRISVNANNVEWPLVIDFLEDLLGEKIESIFERARFSTIETSIDIFGCEHAKLHIMGMRTSITKSYMKGSTNFSFGGDDSHRTYHIYDKQEDIKRLNRKRRNFGRQELPNDFGTITRIEIKHRRCRDGRGINFESAKQLFNFFEELSIYYIPKIDKHFTKEEKLMLRLAMYTSLKVSTAEMSNYLKGKFRFKLSRFKVRLFENIDYEEQLANALDRLMYC